MAFCEVYLSGEQGLYLAFFQTVHRIKLPRRIVQAGILVIEISQCDKLGADGWGHELVRNSALPIGMRQAARRGRMSQKGLRSLTHALLESMLAVY